MEEINIENEAVSENNEIAIILIFLPQATEFTPGTLGISGWGCAAGTLEPVAYTRASSAEFCYPILEQTPPISVGIPIFDT